MRILFLVLCLSQNILAQHIDFIYTYSDSEVGVLTENIKLFSKFVSNDNRYLTTNFKVEQGNGDNLIIKGENVRVTVNILEESNIKQVLLETFQSFSNEYFNEIALRKFNTDLKFPHNFEELEITSENELNQKLSQNFYILYFSHENLESWQAILHFVNALKKSKRDGGLINCLKYSSLCESIDSSLSPKLESYRNQEPYRIFHGTFDEDHVFDWIQTLEQPDITSLTENAVPYYREGMIPGFENARDTVTMLFIPKKNTVVYQNFAKFARENHGRFHLCALVSKEVKKWAHQPAFITMKPKDEFSKAFTLYENITWDRMSLYLEEGLHPSMHEITNSRQLSYALSKQSKPLLIFYDPTKLKDSTGFRKYAAHSQGLIRKAFFGQIQKLDLFGVYLGYKFGISEPTYLLIRKNENGYCMTTRPIGNESEDQLISFVHKLVTEECEKQIESIKIPLERLTKYEMMEEVEELQNQLLTPNMHEEL